MLRSMGIIREKKKEKVDTSKKRRGEGGQTNTNSYTLHASSLNRNYFLFADQGKVAVFGA